MPELILDGPDVPVELMNRRDEGKVVFFCGSGISKDTDLPMFDGLVSQIYGRTAQAPTALEQKLLNKGQLDKVLGLLEGRLNPGRLRREAISILTAPPPENSLVTHQALISLSRHANYGIRLVTTNFDNRFELADPGISIDCAPKLPLPKPHGWGSLVHLHGRITATDGQDLVLTAADFGRAYLTERWASRFITELFREFTIVFVGYSLNDPVMSYMVDALAAERSRGARFQEAYAFADFKDGDDGRRQSELAWQGKNVAPILFGAQDGFGKLTDTLVKWAEISRDPIKSRRQIVFDELRKLPANTSDPIAKRVTWALSDKPTAEALAKAAAITDEEDFPILAGWLDVFDEAGLLSRPANTLADGSARRTPIVEHAFTQHANTPLMTSLRSLPFGLPNTCTSLRSLVGRRARAAISTHTSVIRCAAISLKREAVKMSHLKFRSACAYCGPSSCKTLPSTRSRPLVGAPDQKRRIGYRASTCGTRICRERPTAPNCATWPIDECPLQELV